MGAVGELSPLRGRGEAGLGVGAGWSTAQGAGAAVSFPHLPGTASRSHVWRGADGYHKAPSSSLPPFFQPISCQGTIKGVTHGVGTPRAARAGLGGCCSPPPAVPVLDRWVLGQPRVGGSHLPSSLAGWLERQCLPGWFILCVPSRCPKPRVWHPGHPIPPGTRPAEPAIRTPTGYSCGLGHPLMPPTANYPLG